MSGTLRSDFRALGLAAGGLGRGRPFLNILGERGGDEGGPFCSERHVPGQALPGLGVVASQPG